MSAFKYALRQLSLQQLGSSSLAVGRVLTALHTVCVYKCRQCVRYIAPATATADACTMPTGGSDSERGRPDPVLSVLLASAVTLSLGLLKKARRNHKELHCTKDQLQSKRKELVSAREALLLHQQKLTKAEQELMIRQEHIAALRGEVGSSKSQIETMKRELTMSRKMLDATQHELDRSKYELRANEW